MAEQMNSNSSSKSSSSNSKILIIGFSLMIVAILIVGFAICMVLKSEKSEENNQKNQNQLSENVQPMTTPAHVQKVEKGYFNANMNTTWNFQDGDSVSSDAYVANSYSNLYPVYFEVTLKSTGEQIYKSDVLPLGYEQKGIKLSKSLEKGTYQAICKYHMLDEDGNEVDSISITLTLNILE